MTNPDIKSMKEAKKLVEELHALLPSGFDIFEISVTAKIPYKANSWCGAILHRSFELGQCSIELYESDKFVASAIVSRALMETAGMLYWMLRRVNNVVEEQCIGDIDEYLMRGSLGYRDAEGMPNALNAVSAVDRVDKLFNGFRKIYDILSEFSHPNWSGTFGAFGKNIPETMHVKYGPNIRGLSWGFIPASICLSMMALKYSFENLQNILPQFAIICEKELKSRST